MVREPYCHPSFNKLAPGHMEVLSESPDVASACKRCDEGVDDRDSQAQGNKSLGRDLDVVVEAQRDAV